MGLSIPAYLLNRAPSTLAQNALGGLGKESPPRISIAGNRFTFIDVAKNTKTHDRLTLDVIIVDVNPHVSKTYYEGAWDANAESHEAPACWSDNGVGPSTEAGKPQSTTCAACPQNAWGSKISGATGAKIKACSDTKKIAVMVPDFENRVFILRVPPASLTNLRKYIQTIAGWSLGSRNASPDDLVTRIGFESQGVLNFEAAGVITEEQLGLVTNATANGKTAELLGSNDKPRTLAIAAPEAPQPQPQPQPQAFQAPQPQPQPQVFQAPQPQPAEQKRRGRPPKDANPFSGSPQPELTAVPTMVQAPTPTVAQPASHFGMVNAPAPDAALSAQIAATLASVMKI